MQTLDRYTPTNIERVDIVRKQGRFDVAIPTPDAVQATVRVTIDQPTDIGNANVGGDGRSCVNWDKPGATVNGVKTVPVVNGKVVVDIFMRDPDATTRVVVDVEQVRTSLDVLVPGDLPDHDEHDESAEVAAVAAALAELQAEVDRLPTHAEHEESPDIAALASSMSAALAAVNARIDNLPSGGTGGGAITYQSATMLDFDSLPGTNGTDWNAKIRTMIEYWFASRPEVVIFRRKQYNHTEPIILVSEGKFEAAAAVAAREYGKGTVLNWQGAGAQLRFPYDLPTRRAQPPQSYPNAYAPRAMSIRGIEFRGHTDRQWVTPYDPGMWDSESGNRVWWVSTIEGCSFVGYGRTWWGWTDGISLCGPTHFQAYADTPIFHGSAETALFVGGHGYMDSDNLTGGKPIIRSAMAKGQVGPSVMVTANGNNWPLSIESGHNMTFDFECDAQDAQPYFGSSVQVNGGEAIELRSMSLKGGMTNPSAAVGGVARNRAFVQVNGGRCIILNGVKITRRGNGAPPNTTPLVYAGPNVGVGEVLVGVCGADSWSGAKIRLHEAAAGKINAVPLPRYLVEVVSAQGFADLDITVEAAVEEAVAEETERQDRYAQMFDYFDSLRGKVAA